jgi:hypothetical protein
VSDDGEQRRSIRTLATPLVAASRRWPAALSGTAWLMAAAIGCGLGRGLAALLYLTFSSDTNGGVHSGVVTA